jgi:bifunctional UDP-N-acetylglucosamine pyrophosphorylase/glucosamine-1-phosphate N-acetyltransferase
LNSVGVVVLAAGRGTRMKSTLPKVVHPICGTAMAGHVIAAAKTLNPAKVVVVVGHGGDQVRAALAEEQVEFVEQPDLLGTGDAVGRAQAALRECQTVVVLNGDGPLIRPQTLRQLADSLERAPIAFVSCEVPEPGRLGRTMRDGTGAPTRIIEATDYDGAPGPGEINSGQYAFAADWLWRRLEKIPKAANGEYYLTSLVEQAYDEGTPAVTVAVSAEEALGVDDRVRLAAAEALLRRRILEGHMLEAGTQIAADVTVFPNCYLYGRTVVESGCVIGPGTTLRNARVGPGARVESSVVEDSSIGEGTRVGPFAHVRGGAQIGPGCEIGNYAEVKNSVVGRGVKMHHFSYLGDADVGDEANIAAGTVTCNFDGKEKHRTTIGARAFIGSDTMLVAPVTVGDDAATGAGSVVTRDVPAGARVMGVPARIIGEPGELKS